MNLVVFGDSITWGACDSDRGGWVSRLRCDFESRGQDVSVYNLGISGDTSLGLLERVEGETRVRKSDLVVIAIGTNDSLYIHSENRLQVDIDDFSQNLEKILSVVRMETTKIVFIGLTEVDEAKTQPIPWDVDKSYRNSDINMFDCEIKAFCSRNLLKFISMKEVLGDSDLADGLHPNAEGHEKMFRHIKAELESFLFPV
jgi:lysophospholipase L1-like esterase